MVVTWIEGYFDELHTAGYKSNELALTGIMVNLFSVRYATTQVLYVYVAFATVYCKIIHLTG